MEQPVVIRFRWIDDDLIQASRYHFRHICRPVFRMGLNFLFAIILIGGVLMLVSSGPSGKAPLPVSLLFLFTGIYWFAVLPFDRRRAVRRQFSKRPDRNIDLEWQIADDKIRTQSILGHSEVVWQLEINFEVRQNMFRISNSLQGRRHFCFDANPYAIGRRGLRRNRNVWAVTSSELSHFELESTQSFTKILRTPSGVLLYPIDQIYCWLPRRGFTSDSEFERFIELARGKIQRYYDVV